jgi:hypothetical protein
MALLSLGARYVVEQRVPKIWDYMHVVTRRRKPSGRYPESEFRSITAWDYFQVESF